MKNRSTYKILTWCSWFIPLNRIYIGEKVTIGRILTLNYFMFGLFPDLLYMDKRFDEAMAKRGFVNTGVRDKQER